MRYYSDIKGWKTLYTDGGGNWAGDDGIWAKKAKDGAWFVLRFTNLLEHDREGFKDTPFECTVKRVDFSEIPETEVGEALRSCGYTLSDDGGIRQATWTGSDGKTRGGEMICGAEDAELVILEAVISYGLGAPVYEELGKRYICVRGKARQEAERLMRDAALLEERLDAPYNQVGTTAREAGAGHLVFRGQSEEAKLLKRIGLKPSAKVAWKEMRPMTCKFVILDPRHYRSDGSCKCDDKIHRQTMIQKWGYTEDAFDGISLRTFEPDLGKGDQVVHGLKANGG